VQRLADRLPNGRVLVRAALVVFVLAWIFGPYALQAAVPIWVPFLIALGLELHFFAGGLRPPPSGRADRGPQDADLDLYGYGGDAEEMLLVRDGTQEIWVPYAGETPEEVERLIAEARDLPEEEESAAEAAPEERRSRPALRRLLVGLLVIGGLAAIFWLTEGRTGWNGLGKDTRAQAAARFSREASIVAGKPVTIRCDESGNYVGAVQHADGVAQVGGTLAYLTPERCLALYRLAFEGKVDSSRTGLAIAVLAHEAWHLRGVADEGTTECYALQSGVGLGERLGLSRGDAERQMRAQRVESTLRGRENPAYALPAECRDGGRLDLAPGTERFP
jgi:predicted RNase H-like HicB family nuclease